MEEILDIIDEEDHVVGSAPFSEVHKNNHLHRIIHVFVVNSKGEILLQLRSHNKPTYQGYWTMSIGGHVSSGEDYIDAAIREGKEELGLVIDTKDLEFLGKNDYVNDVGHKIKYQVYKLYSDGPFTPDPYEADKVEFFSLDAIREMIENGEKFHQEMLVSLREYFGL